MGKSSVVFRTEECLKLLAEYRMKLLFTTAGFRLLGIITSDKMIPDESIGVRRRWIKGLAIEDGVEIVKEDRIFETSLHRKNPKSGKLEPVIVHEDDLVVVMERRTFDLSDDEENFQFMPNMHYLNRVQEMKDEVEEGRRRISRLEDEKDQSLVDSEHSMRRASAAVEREKTQRSLVVRLTRENVQLQEQIGNYEAAIMRLRGRNLEYEAREDERVANASEQGTIKGMTDSDLILHAFEKQKDINQAAMDILPDSSGSGTDEQLYEEVNSLKEQFESLKKMIEGGGKQPQAGGS